MIADVFVIKNDVIHGVKRCNVFFTLGILQICFRRLLCNKIEIDQLQCVICCVLGNYDRIISDVFKKNKTGTKKKTQGV